MHHGLHCSVRMAGSSGTNVSSGAAQEGSEQDTVNGAFPTSKAGLTETESEPSNSPSSHSSGGYDVSGPAYAMRQPLSSCNGAVGCQSGVEEGRGLAPSHSSSTTNGVQETASDVSGDRTSEVLENSCSENGSDAVTDEAVDLFPSLHDSQLVQMGLLPFTDQLVSESLTEQDIENRYTSLSLAFKTDKMTLRHRFDLQHRQRDQAERNMQAEVHRLKAAVQKLNRLCVDSESADILTQIQSQVHVLQQSTDQVSNSAEMFGAVQQEQRLSKAVEVMLAHVDNLKRVYEKEHSELEETRRVLTENNIAMGDSSEGADDAVSRGRHRSFQILLGTNKIGSQPGAKRRASIATLPRSSGSSDSIRSVSSTSYLADIKSRFGSSNLRRRPSLNPSHNETLPSCWGSADRLDKSDLKGMDEIEELSESRRESATMAQQPINSSNPAEENDISFMSTTANVITNGNGIPGNPPQELQELVQFPLDSEQEEEEDEDEKHHRLTSPAESVYHPLDCVWDCFSLIFNWVTDLVDPYLPLDGAYILQTVRRGIATSLLIAAAWCVCSTLIPSSSAHPWHYGHMPVSDNFANHPTRSAGTLDNCGLL